MEKNEEMLEFEFFNFTKSVFILYFSISSLMRMNIMSISKILMKLSEIQNILSGILLKLQLKKLQEILLRKSASE